MKVLAAMSGGVDSAVAAALLVEAGHDVTGVHLKLSDVPLDEQVPGQGCCTLDDASDARRAAQVLDIPFYVWDLSDRFRSEVQDPFAAAYADGVTPNPCVTCNERVKYAALLDRARSLGFDALATGHHARLRTDSHVTQLLRATDPRKDQSYVLYMASPEQLAHTLLPVGELTKGAVRAHAADLGLRVANKPESFDVCFIPSGDTAGYLSQHLDARPGEIVDVDGTPLGTHDGIWNFTVGQRRGLGLGTHERRFVVDVDAPSNRVVVGAREALACGWIEVDGLVWRGAVDPSQMQVRLQIRAHGSTVPARVTPTEAGVRITVDEPMYGVARGQAAVLYDATDQVCLGGGRITAAERPALPVAVTGAR